MRAPVLDPTAGERARRIHASPDAPECISDPMDSRWGGVPGETPVRQETARPIVDPTDPECGDSLG
jgi:hypothetical protein